MIRQLFAVLLMIGWAGSAGAGETACRVLGTTTFEVGKTVCIPGMRPGLARLHRDVGADRRWVVEGHRCSMQRAAATQPA